MKLELFKVTLEDYSQDPNLHIELVRWMLDILLELPIDSSGIKIFQLSCGDLLIF